MELRFNTVIPWDETDLATTQKPNDAQIVATGPKFMIVHLGNEWIDLDVIVAHAPHSWDTKHQEGAEEVTFAFWEKLCPNQTCGATCTIFFLGDANLELSTAQACYEGIGQHQPAKEATIMQAFVL